MEGRERQRDEDRQHHDVRAADRRCRPPSRGSRAADSCGSIKAIQPMKPTLAAKHRCIEDRLPAADRPAPDAAPPRTSRSARRRTPGRTHRPAPGTAARRRARRGGSATTPSPAIHSGIATRASSTAAGTPRWSAVRRASLTRTRADAGTRHTTSLHPQPTTPCPSVISIAAGKAPKRRPPASRRQLTRRLGRVRRPLARARAAGTGSCIGTAARHPPKPCGRLPHVG